MKHLYEDPAEIRFAFSESDRSFEYKGATYDIRFAFTDQRDVGVEMNGIGQLVIYPVQAPQLRWTISREAFMSGVSAIGAAGASQTSADTLFVWFPAKKPRRNFAISRAAFEFGISLAMLVMEDFDAATADVTPEPSQRRDH
ncbi:MAG: hypothetical protein AAF638_07705 [Pseudomonadota bacterium]